jgi:hypothetical protein
MVNRAEPTATPVPIQTFAGPNEQEDNDSYLQANKSLVSGRTYNGLANDQKDYFGIYVRAPGTINVTLGNGPAVNLILYYQEPLQGAELGFDTSDNAGKSVTFNATQTGWYYIYVNARVIDSAPYTLRVTYPD